MAVQAHFRHDFSTRTRSNVLDELETHQLHGLLNPPLDNNFKIKDCVSDPQNELIMNGCGWKKRNREESSSSMDLTMIPIHFGGSAPNMFGSVVDPSIPVDQMRAIDSIGTSTSGRISCASASLPISQALIVAHLYQQSLEIDALIRLQNERLRLGLEQAQKRHCRSLISLLEQQLVKMLKEKDAELEDACRKNAELEGRVRQMTVENQTWYNLAKNNEVIVANLKTSLEQVLLQNAVNNNAVHGEEGYGDSGGMVLPAGEAQSCCILDQAEAETNGSVKIVTATEGPRAGNNLCKLCCEKEVGVLLLPCRHLCLCLDCESKTDTCPVCHASRNASLQIFLP